MEKLWVVLRDSNFWDHEACEHDDENEDEDLCAPEFVRFREPDIIFFTEAEVIRWIDAQDDRSLLTYISIPVVA